MFHLHLCRLRDRPQYRHRGRQDRVNSDGCSVPDTEKVREDVEENGIDRVVDEKPVEFDGDEVDDCEVVRIFIISLAQWSLLAGTNIEGRNHFFEREGRSWEGRERNDERE